MSGYCDTGSVINAMPPASVMTIERTVAKIGRSMKKWLMFTARCFVPPPVPQSELAWDRLSHRDALSADRPRPLVRRRPGPYGSPAYRHRVCRVPRDGKLLCCPGQ